MNRKEGTREQYWLCWSAIAPKKLSSTSFCSSRDKQKIRFWRRQRLPEQARGIITAVWFFLWFAYSGYEFPSPEGSPLLDSWEFLKIPEDSEEFFYDPWGFLKIPCCFLADSWGFLMIPFCFLEDSWDSLRIPEDHFRFSQELLRILEDPWIWDLFFWRFSDFSSALRFVFLSFLRCVVLALGFLGLPWFWA